MKFFKLADESSTLHFTRLGSGQTWAGTKFILYRHDFHPSMIFEFEGVKSLYGVEIADVAQTLLEQIYQKPQKVEKTA